MPLPNNSGNVSPPIQTTMAISSWLCLPKLSPLVLTAEEERGLPRRQSLITEAFSPNVMRLNQGCTEMPGTAQKTCDKLPSPLSGYAICMSLSALGANPESQADADER